MYYIEYSSVYVTGNIDNSGILQSAYCRPILSNVNIACNFQYYFTYNLAIL